MADPTFPTDPIDAAVDPEQWLYQHRVGPVQNALKALDDNPDEAAQALTIGPQIGVPPSIVHTDLEGYQQQHKAALTSALLEGNEHLRDYIMSHPLAASVSSNDWGQLDTVSEKLAAFGKGGKSTLQAAIEGFMGAFGGPPGSSYMNIPQYKAGDILPELTGKEAAEGAIGGVVAIAGAPLELAFRLPGGIITASTQALAEAVKQATGKDISDQTENFLKVISDPGMWASIGFPDPLVGISEFLKANKDLRQTIDKALPYVSAKKAPPYTISKVLTDAEKLQTKDDAKAIQDLMAEAAKSETREKASELFRDNFVKPQVENARIGLDAEAVLKLYGDKRPTPDDGKLGWVPGIEEQFDRAVATGADIDIPLADWVAQADPELAKELKDHVRVRAGGLTPEEAKEAKPPKVEEAPKPEGEAQVEEAPPTLIDTIREASGLVPTGWDVAPGAAIEPGIIPEKTLLGEVIEYPDYQTQSIHSFPASEALAALKKDQLIGVPRALAEFFGDKLKALAGDTPIHVISDADMVALTKSMGLKGGPAFYEHNRHHIVMNETTANGGHGYSYAAKVIMHEAAHAFTSRSLETFPELRGHIRAMMDETQAALKAAGMTEDVKAYGFKNEHEFVAEAFSNPRFQEILATTRVSKDLASRLGLDVKRQTIWDAMKGILNKLIEQLTGFKMPPTMMDGILHLGPSFEEGHEIIQAMKDSFREFGVHEAEPIPDYLRQAFKTGSALKMNNERLKAYLEAVAKQHAEDIKFSKDQETLKAGREATKEWEENLPRVAEEARKDIYSRPDIALDRYLRGGELPNGSTERKVKLWKDAVPDDLRKRIPADFIGDRGLHPDVLASRFGLQSGREVMEHLARLEEQRQQEGLTPAAHLTQTVNAETQRRMTKDYGRSAEDILNDAKEHVLSPTTHDILHNELAALYEAQGQKPVTQTAFKAFAKTLFDRIPIGLHSSDGYMAEMHRQRTVALDHLLEGNAVESLKAQEKAAMLAYHADLALKQEKLKGQFDRKVNNWQRREPSGVDQAEAIWLHDILQKIGIQPKRIAGDLERQKAMVSPYATLRDFVNHVSDTVGQDPDSMFPGQFPVSEFLLDDGFKKPVDELTPPEFKDVFNSLKAIDAYSRNEKKLTVRGDKIERDKVVGGLVDRLKAAVNNKQLTPGKKQTVSPGRTIGSLLLNPESWAHRLDLGNAFGPFNQLIIKPVMEGLYAERDFEKEFNKKWQALPDIGKREKIENPNLFMDPATNFQTPMELDTHSLRAIIQNMGNELQRKKLAAGYGIDDPNKIWDWLFNTIHIDREHFKFAQQMGDIFSEAFEHAEKADVRRFGVAAERIELGEIQTPWGVEREWYHPLIPDGTRHSGSLKAEDMLEESGFYRPSPASGFAKTRTGMVYPIDLSFDSVPFKLKQILKYAAVSEPISEVSKIVLDSRFRTAFKQYYGQEYDAGLVKWLKDSAGYREWIPSNEKTLGRAMGTLQENMSSALIGWNLGTVLKHGPTALIFSMREVGPVNFARSALQMIKEAPGGREAWTDAFEKSAELRSRLRSVSETIQGTNEELFKKFEFGHKYFTVHDAIKLAGHYPVAMSDLMSAVPMWDAAYRTNIAKGLEEGDAVYAANTAVRRTHGSTIIGARAGITRINNPFVRAFMPFYNFFSNALQRNYEMMWRSKLAMQGRELPEMHGFEKESYERGLKHLPYILGGVLTYGPLVSLIEQAVDPLTQGEEEGNFKFWGKVLTRGYFSQVPFIRDLINGLFTGHDPSAGLTGTALRNVAEALKPSTWSGEDPAKTFRKTNAVLGAFTGLTNEQVGKAGQFLYNWSTGKEDSIEGPVDVYEAFRHGTLNKQPRSLPELGEEVMGVPRSQR